MDSTTRDALGALLFVAIGSLGCITLPWNNDETPDRPDISGLDCGSFETAGGSTMGFFWDDYEPLGDGCNDIPVEPGFQGGFHITPLIYVPVDEMGDLRGGVSTVTVTFLQDSEPPIEQSLEGWPEAWDPAEDGFVYTQRIIMPNDLVSDGGRWPVQIDFTYDFDDTEAEDITVTREMELYL